MRKFTSQAFEDARLTAADDLKTTPLAIAQYTKKHSLKDERVVIIKDASESNEARDEGG